MSDPLDNLAQVARDEQGNLCEELLVVFYERGILVQDLGSIMSFDDPISILVQCEERDEQEGWIPGTALEMYLQEQKTEEDRK